MDNRALRVFRDNVRTEFAFLKSARNQFELQLRSIPIEGTDCSLVPLAEVHADDSVLISRLSEWRRANSLAYPTRFEVTNAGTSVWIRDAVLAVHDRLMFIVQDRHGQAMGHLGFANSFNDAQLLEFDNVVRGVSGIHPGLMASAMHTLRDWANRTLWPEGFVLRVLESNAHARRFYARLGFVPTAREPLRLRRSADRECLEPVQEHDQQAPDDAFVTMTLVPNEYQSDGKTILTAGPSISAREVAYTADAARSGWNDRWNSYLTAFQSKFADYVGARHALATSSGTGALHIALAALGIGPGDEVIVPDITWVATANAVLYIGATPVFADVEEDTWCLDPASCELKVTSRTKAIMPVHLYGHPARMDAIMDIALRHGLYVVEDAAPSIGAEVLGRRTGSFGHFAAFSFQGAKLAVTGEGGMLVTSDADLYERAVAIWDQGRRPGTFWIQSNGLKYKMANPLAALGVAQLERNDAMVEAKRRIFRWYADRLVDLPWVSLNKEAAWARSIYWMTSLLLHDDCPIDRDTLRMRLRDSNIDSRPVFPAISRYPIWGREIQPQPVANRIGDRALNLPSGVCLTEAQVAFICRVIRETLR